MLEHFKTRSAWIFVPTLLIFFAVIIVGGLICDKVPPETFFYGLTGFGLLGLTLIGMAIRRARKRNRYESSLLSRDEINKARSKLGKTKI